MFIAYMQEFNVCKVISLNFERELIWIRNYVNTDRIGNQLRESYRFCAGNFLFRVKISYQKISGTFKLKTRNNGFIMFSTHQDLSIQKASINIQFVYFFNVCWPLFKKRAQGYSLKEGTASIANSHCTRESRGLVDPWLCYQLK